MERRRKRGDAAGTPMMMEGGGIERSDETINGFCREAGTHLRHTAAVMMRSIIADISTRGSIVNLFASLYTAAKSEITLAAIRGYRS